MKLTGRSLISRGFSGEQKRVEASGRQVRTKYFVFHVTNFELFSSQVCEEWCTRVLRLGARALPQGDSDVARTGVGPRHEGSMDTACDLLPIYPRVFGFTQGGLAALPFHADTHVRAIMMHMVWDEMRARENLKDKDERTLGPLASRSSTTSCGRWARCFGARMMRRFLASWTPPSSPSPPTRAWPTGTRSETLAPFRLSTGRA